MSKMRVAVIAGGISEERDVSLKSGKIIAANLDRKKYLVSRYDPKTDLPKLINDCQKKKIDLCFLVLHGRGGEDGAIQGLLELLKVKYTGSDILSSALCFDKFQTKQKLKTKKIFLPKDLLITKKVWQQQGRALFKNFHLPAIVKPNASGSSFGITIAKDVKSLEKSINAALQYDKTILVEEYITGREITVPVLGEIVLPLIEIRPRGHAFFDYDAKYIAGEADEIVPAPITKKSANQISRLALNIHQTLGCHGLTRLDFILKGNKPYFLEINTLPGMTENSLCPKSARAAGLTISDFLDRIINLALS